MIHFLGQQIPGVLVTVVVSRWSGVGSFTVLIKSNDVFIDTPSITVHGIELAVVLVVELQDWHHMF